MNEPVERLATSLTKGFLSKRGGNMALGGVAGGIFGVMGSATANDNHGFRDGFIGAAAGAGFGALGKESWLTKPLGISE